jgi:site-specific DNA-methyltransferase (adenine-specific)
MDNKTRELPTSQNYEVDPEVEASGEIEPQETRIGKDNRELNTEAIGTSANAEVELIDPFEEWVQPRLLTGDSLEILPTLNKKYDLAIIDPPYGITTEKWDLANKRELIAFTDEWLRKLIPLLKPSARLFIFWSRDYMFELKPILDDLKKDYPTWEFGGMLVWHFRNVGSMPDNTKRYKLAWEPIFYYYGHEAKPLNFTRTEVSGETWKGEKQWDVWTYAIPQSNYGDTRIHPTQKPLELYKHIMESASHVGDNVIDCFAGSGTTGHAAILTGREFTLIEQSKTYVENIKNRLKPVWTEGRNE